MQGEVVALTGACGLIGSAFARALVANGTRVALGDSNTASAAELEAELGTERTCVIPLDVTRNDSIESFLSGAEARFGRLDAAVHCAYPRSQHWGTPFGSLSEAGLREDLYGQLGGTILFSQAAIARMKTSGGGTLVLIGSIQGAGTPKFHHYEGTSMSSPIEYTAIKAGVIAMTRYLARWCRGTGIRVNCLSPGGVENHQPEPFVARYRNDCLSKGLLAPNDLCGALLFLLSKDSQYMNGQNLIVDDGWSL